MVAGVFYRKCAASVVKGNCREGQGWWWCCSKKGKEGKHRQHKVLSGMERAVEV